MCSFRHLVNSWLCVKLNREIQELTASKKDESKAIVVSEQVEPCSIQLPDVFSLMLNSSSETSDAHKVELVTISFSIFC